MTAQLLDGKLVASQIQQKIEMKVQRRLAREQRAPGLAVVIVGEDPASKIYVRNKRIACEKLNFHSLAFDLPDTTTQQELEELIQDLNHNEKVDGIIIQTPLPPHLDSLKVIESIKPHKDVDGFHPYNVGRLALRRPLLRPCTPFGITRLLKHYAINLTGIHAVIVGASNIVGRPMALELLLSKSTVTVCHRYTQNLASVVAAADLLVVAIGKPNIVSSSWLKDNVILVDVGINRLANGKICGDLDFKSAKQIASWITPVPGGVGPMTVTMLLENTLKAAEMHTYPLA
jgi:methylenetetrahydrofolate dehydrogenase (NADP+)/methenyltetrahydrofolate cyclohydrolase